jgi:NADPH:quinone reductase-like Zn-dependent oxidoreductase
MKASVFERFGGPDVVGLLDLPVPSPSAGEVVVRVAASTVNPTDLMMRSGQHAAQLRHLQPPFIAGMEFAGVVHAGGDLRLQIGLPVMGIVNPRRAQGGSHAEYVCVPAASLAVLPMGVDLAKAATVPMNGLTAKAAIDAVGLRPGAKLLVTGGAGAVAGYIVSLAKRAGLHVIADAKSSDHALLRTLGTDEIVPRGDGMAAAVLQSCPDGVDAVIDTAMLGDGAAALARAGGTFVSLRSSQVISDKRLRIVRISVLEHADNTEALDWLVQRWIDGTLEPRVALQVPVERSADAHRALEQRGLRGRVLLVF